MLGCRGIRDRGAYNHKGLIQLIINIHVGNTPYRERGKIICWIYYMSLKHKVLCINMYLNVNLTTPSTGTDSLSSIPKTPEILNSLISLTASPLPPSYSSYQRQVNRDVLSPTSSNDSTTDEVSATRFGGRIKSRSSQLSPLGLDPSSNKYHLTRSSRVFRGAKTSLTGTPSPPVPELPSPVSTIEATKSALIKEGLKHQIKSKLQAAGVGPQALLIDTAIKEEYSDSDESLTPQDEERRMRRRERNKIAATKCRNKKKERTIILMTESESVEDQNIRLKNEIQRLSSEKMKLEKLLDDPSHLASCRHSCGRSSIRSAPSLVLTSPDAPELLSSTISEAPFTSGVSPNLIHQCTSEQNSDANTTLLYCSPNFPSSCESTFAINEPSPSSSYQTVSSGSSISPCSASNISPSQNFLPKNIPQTVSLCSQLPNVPTTSYGNEATTILELTSSKNTNSVCMPNLHPQQSSEAYCYDPEPHSTSVRSYLPINASYNLTSRRHQPYASAKPTYTRPSPYSGHSSHDDITSHEVQSQRDYLPNLLLDDSGLTNKDYSYSYETEAKSLLSNDLSCGTSNQSQNINYNNIGKIKSTTHNRYAPYNRANRNQPSQPAAPTDGCSQSIQNIQLPEEYLQIPQSFDFQSNSNQFLTDLSNNTFYPPCTFGEL